MKHPRPEFHSRIETLARAVLLAVAVCAVLLAPPALAQGQPLVSHAAGHVPPSAVIARVNGSLITGAELAAELTAAGIAGHARSPKLAAEVRRQALEELIARELIYQDAQKRGIRVTPAEITRALEQARQERLARGQDQAALRRDIERRLVVEKATALALAARAAVREDELEKLYRQQQARFRKPEEVKLRAILAPLGPSPKPEERAAARKKIEKVQMELNQGADFAAVARKYSDDAYRARGGLIGWVHRGRLDPEVENVAFSLPAGKVSAPFETKYGFLILKAEGKRAARQLRYAEVGERLRAELKQQKMAEARDAWIAELKRNARIEILAAAPS